MHGLNTIPKSYEDLLLEIEVLKHNEKIRKEKTKNRSHKQYIDDKENKKIQFKEYYRDNKARYRKHYEDSKKKMIKCEVCDKSIAATYYSKHILTIKHLKKLDIIKSENIIIEKTQE